MRLLWLVPMFVFGCGKVDESDGVDDTDVASIDVDGDGSAAGADCDDAEANVFPGADEIIADGIDQNCDGGELCFSDADGDGFRADATIVSSDIDCADPGEAAADAPSGDCSDGNADRNPDADELCDPDDVDENCDELIDEEDPNALGCVDWSGSYSGKFELSAYVPAFSDADTCVGIGAASVEKGEDGAVTISVSCSFTGTLAAYITGVQSGSAVGTMTDTYAAAGTVTLSFLSDTWAGDFLNDGTTGKDTLVATFDGTAPYSGVDVQYTGVFVGTR